MYKFNISRIISFLERNGSFFNQQCATDLLNKVQSDLARYHPIDFYRDDVSKNMTDALSNIQDYLTALKTLQWHLHEEGAASHGVDDSVPSQDTISTELSVIIAALEKKYQKINRLHHEMPFGILDVKRALYSSRGHELSQDSVESRQIQDRLSAMQLFLKGINENYHALVAEGHPISQFPKRIASFYWSHLQTFRTILSDTLHHLETCRTLTEKGRFIKKCIHSALQKIPAFPIIAQATKHLSSIQYRKKINQPYAFISDLGLKACMDLTRQKKRFFYHPSRDDRYRFDYDPLDDFAQTGGDCFGESVAFITSICQGTLKLLCPESLLVNNQIDQTIAFRSRTLLGEAQTEISENSVHDYVQWDDIQPLFLSNPNFLAGDCCLIRFSVNEYIKSKSHFTPGHAASIIKLGSDEPYRYVVFEKKLGVIGCGDDETVQYVLEHLILPLYQGMQYATIKLEKVASATEKTTLLLRQTNPMGMGDSLFQDSFFKPSVTQPLSQDAGGKTPCHLA